MDASNQAVRPVSDGQRIAQLDVLRGIAILFIFLANTASFSGYVVLSDTERMAIPGNGLGAFSSALLEIFIDGKWYSVFSILFGIGFAIQYSRILQRGQSFPLFFSKRMLGLLLIGGIHLIFFWMGDILTLYALLGLLLIPFRNIGNKTLLWTAGVLLFMPIAHNLLMGLIGPYPGLLFEWMGKYQSQFGIVSGPALAEGMTHPFMQYIQLSTMDDFIWVTPSNAAGRLALILFEGRIFKVFALFLLGLWAGRQILEKGLLENYKLLRKLFVYGLIIGLPFNVLKYAANDIPGDLGMHLWYASYAIGVVPLAIAYAAGLALLWRHSARWLRLFAPAGKMALTCYLSQTFVSIPIYYGIGLGLAGQLPEWVSLTITVSIFLLQLGLCTLWLKHYKMGPIEWVWRKMTYGQISFVRKKQSIPTASNL